MASNLLLSSPSLFSQFCVRDLSGGLEVTLLLEIVLEQKDQPVRPPKNPVDFAFRALKYVFNDGKMELGRLKHLVDIIGRKRLVLDLSCRKKDGKYVIVTDRWQKFSDVYLSEESLHSLTSYADEFLVHGVDVEGKRLGIDEELVALLGQCSPIPITCANGVPTMADLERIKTAGMAHVDATIGSALDVFGGNLAYKDVVGWHQNQATVMQ